MKLIATRGFLVTPKARPLLKFDPSTPPVHERAAQHGAIFTIGGDAEYDALTEDEKGLYRDLLGSKHIGDANDAKVVAKVNADAKNAKDRQEEAKKAVAAGSQEQLAAASARATVQALVELGIIKAPKAA